MARYLLDTDVLVDLSKGREPAQTHIPAIVAAGDVLGICAVQLAEFYAGQPRGHQPEVDAFLDALRLWAISRDAAIRAGHYRHAFGRRGRALATPDALTAAVAWRMSATVVTRNVKHYPMADVQTLSI